MSAVAWFLITYFVIALFFLRPLASHFAYRYSSVNYDLGPGATIPNPKADQWFLGYLWAMCLMPLWPIVAICGVSNHLPAIGAEKKYSARAIKK